MGHNSFTAWFKQVYFKMGEVLKYFEIPESMDWSRKIGYIRMVKSPDSQ